MELEDNLLQYLLSLFSPETQDGTQKGLYVEMSAQTGAAPLIYINNFPEFHLLQDISGTYGNYR